jgi:magnesium-transporting ATPase (P-type)
VQQGFKVPADCVLIKCALEQGIKVNSSQILYGKQLIKVMDLKHALKNCLTDPEGRQPFLLGGSFVENGFGKAIVCAVGINS